MTLKKVTTIMQSVQQAGLTEYLIILTIATGFLLFLWSGRLLRRAMREDEERGLLDEVDLIEEMGLDNARFLDDCELGRSRIPVTMVFTPPRPNNSFQPLTLLELDESRVSIRKS